MANRCQVVLEARSPSLVARSFKRSCKASLEKLKKRLAEVEIKREKEDGLD
jgi:hypothetical protein